MTAAAGEAVRVVGGRLLTLSCSGTRRSGSPRTPVTPPPGVQRGHRLRPGGRWCGGIGTTEANGTG